MAKGIYIGDKNDNSREIATKLLIGDKNNKARSIIKILIGDKNNRARLVYVYANEVLDGVLISSDGFILVDSHGVQLKPYNDIIPVTTINIYNKYGAILCSKSVETTDETILSINKFDDNVSAVEVNGEFILDNHDDVNSHVYYSNFIGLSADNDGDVTDKDDIRRGTSVSLQVGKTYNYYLVTDGTYITIDSEEYWIPDPQETPISWDEAVQDNLIPSDIKSGIYMFVFKGNHILYPYASDTGFPIYESDFSYTTKLCIAPEYKYVGNMYVTDIGDTWEQALSKVVYESPTGNYFANDFYIEDEKIYFRYEEDRVVVKYSDGRYVNPSDEIISNYAYIYEEVVDAPTITFTIDGQEHSCQSVSWIAAIDRGLLPPDFTYIYNDAEMNVYYKGMPVWEESEPHVEIVDPPATIISKRYYTTYNDCLTCGRPIMPEYEYCEDHNTITFSIDLSGGAGTSGMIKTYTVPNGSTWEEILNDSDSELSKDGYFWDDYGNPVWYTDNLYIVIYESNNGMVMPQETIIANENYRLEGYPVEITINGETVQVPGLTTWIAAHYMFTLSNDFRWEDDMDGDFQKVLYRGEYLIGPDGEEVIGMHPIITGGVYYTVHIHTEGERVREYSYAPDCIHEGEEHYKIYCVDCGALIREETVIIPPLGHNDQDRDYVCDECGENLCATHRPAILPAVAPSCTTTGLTEGEYCSRCQQILVAQQTVAATGHSPGHAETRNEKAATCEQEGSYDLVVCCHVCGVELSRQTITIPATGHNYESKVTKESTCTTTGIRTYTCKNDSSHTYTETIAALEHDYEYHDAQQPTCNSDGWDSYQTCKYCDYTTYKRIPKYEHIIEGSIKYSYNDAESLTQHKHLCDTCEVPDEYKAYKMEDHDFTYDTSSDTVHKCICGKEQAHSWGKWSIVDENNHQSHCGICTKAITQPHTWPSSWTSDGVHTTHSKQCMADGCEAYLEEEHNYIDQHDGTHKCICGEQFQHQWTSWTDDGNGNHSHTCIYCNAVESIPHNWEYTEIDNALHKAVCSCGAEFTEYHSFPDEWYEEDENTHGHTCIKCSAFESEPHDFTQNEDGTYTCKCGLPCTHMWEVVPPEDPTCWSDGWSAHNVCTICGEVDGYETIPGGHQWFEVDNNGHAYSYMCDVCGETRLECDHEYDSEGNCLYCDGENVRQ